MKRALLWEQQEIGTEFTGEESLENDSVEIETEMAEILHVQANEMYSGSESWIQRSLDRVISTALILQILKC
jgi:hypothetical protein